jgi:hypothetical protein
MAFHFPLMPRIFMGLRAEERHPFVEIMNQTPEIPDGCQWAIFLRNHDELTLEMVTDEERDYMYAQYAADPQMRLNVGIRRRLAPLMEKQPAPHRADEQPAVLDAGTPIIYYGDEIGMGDNVYLGDRNGVRTPMQWSSDRNAGFSRADPARLYFPVIMDPVYGYEAINVEAQERSPFSLLHWMKRMIALRGSIRCSAADRSSSSAPTIARSSPTSGDTRTRRFSAWRTLSRAVQPVEIPLAAVRRPDASRAPRPDAAAKDWRPTVFPDARALRLLLVQAAGRCRPRRVTDGSSHRRTSGSAIAVRGRSSGTPCSTAACAALSKSRRWCRSSNVNDGSAARRVRSRWRGLSTGPHFGAVTIRRSHSRRGAVQRRWS